MGGRETCNEASRRHIRLEKRLIHWFLGELQSVDGYMNIALEKCEEHVNGVKKRSYGDAFIRGNNGMLDPIPGLISYARRQKLIRGA